MYVADHSNRGVDFGIHTDHVAALGGHVTVQGGHGSVPAFQSLASSILVKPYLVL